MLYKFEFQKEGRNGSIFHLPLGLHKKIQYTELKSSYWVKVRISLLHLLNIDYKCLLLTTVLLNNNYNS